MTCDLMFDAWLGWDVPYAIEMGRRMAPYDPRWLEEPVPPDRIGAYAEIRRATGIPIASGEHEYTRWGFKVLLDAEGVDVVQADPDWTGGITEMVKICALASAYDKPVIPHGHSVLPALHLIAAQSPAVCPLLEFLLVYLSKSSGSTRSASTRWAAWWPCPRRRAWASRWTSRASCVARRSPLGADTALAAVSPQKGAAMTELHPLPPDRLPALRPLLRAPCPLEAEYALEAMIAGHLTCQAWADDPAAPTLAYLWNGASLHYVLGARTPAAEAAIAALFSATIAPGARAAAAYYTKLRPVGVGWDDWLPPVPGARRSARVAYLLDPARQTGALALGAPAPQVAEGYRLVEIDAALLADETLDTAAARDEIASCWPSVALFHAQGYGYGVLAGRELVAWCTAELVSPGRCGVGIETVAAHQRRGLGTAVAVAMAQRCRREGRTALWDAWAANSPSRRTAERAGWALAEEYTVAFAVLGAEG